MVYFLYLEGSGNETTLSAGYLTLSSLILFSLGIVGGWGQELSELWNPTTIAYFWVVSQI